MSGARESKNPESLPRRSKSMSADHSLRVLREANPRNQPGFERSLARYDALRTDITATPVSAPPIPLRPGRRLRFAGVSAVAAAVALAAVLIGVLATASPPNAYAAARKAVAATSAGALRSGTMTLVVTHRRSRWTLYTVRWNGQDIVMSNGQGHSIGSNRQLRVAGGSVYLQEADGHWVRYTAKSSIHAKFGSAVQLAQADAAGGTATAILALTTHLHKTVRPDGSTLYTGTIPPDRGAAIAPADDSIMRVITRLRSVGRDSRFQLMVGRDGLVRRMSETFQNEGTQLNEPGKQPVGAGSWTWSISYSQLGSTPPISAPSASSPAAH
jgi:hypothetical protein